jgi:hypothetical protein
MIEDIKPLQQFMDDGSMLLPDMPAVFRLMQALGAPAYVDYDYILSISGAAFRLSWQQGWAAYEAEPNQGSSFIDGEEYSEYTRAFSGLGVSYTTHYIKGRKDNDGKAGIVWNTVDEAKADIIASVDRGIPVIIHGPCVGATVLGYEKDDDLSGGDVTFYGVAVFADAGKRIAPHNYNKFDDWQGEIKAYFIIDSYTPYDMDKLLLTKTLKTAVTLARTSRLEKLGDTALGISAFDALVEQLVWDESFEPLEPGKRYEGEISFPYDRPTGYYREDGARTLGDRFWAGYCDFLCMLNGYGNFSRFLVKQAENNIVPEWSEQLKIAAEYYHKACDYSGKLWDYVTPDDAGVAKFKEMDVRYAFAAHMMRAKIYTVKAIEVLEKILKVE